MGTRAQGLAIGPITFAEIDAYQRLTHAGLSAWDVRLIRRLDLATQAVKSGHAPAGPTDVKGMKATLRAAVARRAKAAATAQSKGAENA